MSHQQIIQTFPSLHNHNNAFLKRKSSRCIPRMSFGCWRSPQGKEMFVPLPWDKPQQLLWVKHLLNCTLTQEDGFSLGKRGLDLVCIAIADLTPPPGPDLPSSPPHPPEHPSPILPILPSPCSIPPPHELSFWQPVLLYQCFIAALQQPAPAKQ